MEKQSTTTVINIVLAFTLLCIIIGNQWYLCPDMVTRIIFTFHIPILFITGGIMLKAGDVKELAVKTFSRLMIPYVIACIIIVIISGIHAVIISDSAVDVFHDFMLWLWAAFYGSGMDYITPTYIRMIGALCFLPALFFAINITHLCIRAKNTWVWIILCAAAGFATGKIFWLPYSIQTAMTGTIFVMAGYTFGEKCRQKSTQGTDWNELIKKYRYIPVICAILTAVYIAKGGGQLFMVNNTYVYGLWDWLAAMCASVVIFYMAYVISRHLKRLTAVCESAGRHFIQLFCIHMIELTCFPWSLLLEELSDISWMNTAFEFIIFFIIHAALIAVGMLILLGIKKISGNIHNIKKQKQESTEPWQSEQAITKSGLKKTEQTDLGQEEYKKSDNVTNESVKSQNIKQAPVNVKKGRVEWVDMAKGVCILLMLYAHMPIDSGIRRIIFSFHMPAFMLLSGYFTKNRPWKNFFKSTFKGLLLPYFGIELIVAFVRVWRYWLYIGIDFDAAIELIRMQVKTAVLGMSFSSTIFTDVTSVFVIWFVICLFFARMLFIAILKISREKEWLTAILVAAVTIAGWYIGTQIAYLPESFDVSMTSTAFIYAGYLLNKYHAWDYLKNHPLSILITGVIWLAQILCGGIELSVRSYPVLPLSLAGAVAGTVILCLVCQVISRYKIPVQVLKFFGKNSFIVLGIHCVEAQFIYWEGLLAGADVNMQFLVHMICICSTMIIWIVFKLWFKYVQKIQKGGLL